MKKKAAVYVAFGAILLSGCGASSSPAPVTVTAPAETVTATLSADPSSEEPAATPEEISPEPGKSSKGPAGETFLMPKVTGMVLQDAQDLLQSLGSYLMDQQDAMGYGRLQIDDSNWQVCAQKPKAGVKAPLETVVVLKVVKLREDCP